MIFRLKYCRVYLMGKIYFFCFQWGVRKIYKYSWFGYNYMYFEFYYLKFFVSLNLIIFFWICFNSFLEFF